MKQLKLFFLTLFKSENGSAILLVSLGMVAMLTAVGAAVDMSRLQTLQARISSALDAAGLAAGATANSPPSPLPANCTQASAQSVKQAWVQCQAQRFFNSNLPPGYLNNNGITLTTSISSDGSTLTLTATGTQNTSFMKLVGVSTLNIGAVSKVTLAQNNMVELVLVLDNTGSMRSPVSSSETMSKMDSLKCDLLGNISFSETDTTTVPAPTVTCPANQGLLDILQASSSHIYVAIAPFSGLTTMQLADLSQSAIKTKLGVPPLTDACTDARDGYTASASQTSLKLDEADDTSASSPFYVVNIPALNGGAGGCPAGRMQGLTSLSTAGRIKLNTAIEGMSSYGSTYLNIGMAWGNRLISENWSGKWASASDTYSTPVAALPMPASTANLKRVVVFMTDGVENFDGTGAYGGNEPLTGGYSYPSTSYPTSPKQNLDTVSSLQTKMSGCQSSKLNELCNTYTDLIQFQLYSGINYTTSYNIFYDKNVTTGPFTTYNNFFPTSSPYPSSNKVLDQKFLETCTALKNQGVTIYTIGYGKDTNASTQTVSPIYEGSTFLYNFVTPPPLDQPGSQCSTSDVTNHKCGATGNFCGGSSPSYPRLVCQPGGVYYNNGTQVAGTCDQNQIGANMCAVYEDSGTWCIVPYTEPTPGAYGPGSGGVAIQANISYIISANASCNAPNYPPYIDLFNSGVYVATNALQQCATDPAHYFNASSNAALQSAFQTIGAQVTQLHISQ
jgi:Flp pilus assembly protein TadG